MGKLNYSELFSITEKYAKLHGERVYSSADSKKCIQSVNIDDEDQCSIIFFSKHNDICTEVRRIILPRVVDPEDVAKSIRDGRSYLFTSVDPNYTLLKEIAIKIGNDITSGIVEKLNANKGWELARRSQFANINDLPPAEHCIAVAAAKLRDLALAEWRTKISGPLDNDKIREFILGRGFKKTHEEIVEYYLREVINESLFADSLKYADMFYNMLISTNLLHVFDKK